MGYIVIYNPRTNTYDYYTDWSKVPAWRRP